MRISLGPFRGRIPRVSDRTLPESNATIAEGADLRSGEIRPFRQSALVEALGSGDWGTIFRWYEADGGEAHWLQFPPGVDVIQGPVADDVWQRIYWTGDSRYDEPRMSYTGPIQTGGGAMPNVSYKMGVPAPDGQITIAPEPAITGDIAAIANERPIRVTTQAPHGLESGELVQFDVEAEAPDGGVNDLAEFLSGNDFQIRVTGEDEFTLDDTDAFNVEYSAFTSGTFTQYFDPGLLTTRFYVHTYVTELGEEGPPSDPSESAELAHNQKVTLTLPSITPSESQGRLISRMRIYRTATGNRFSQFQFVGEVGVAEDTFEDEVDTADLGEPLPSGQWDGPSLKMKGLRLAAQGFAVGFYDNKVAFSEPYMVHAWPTSYQLALDFDVVAVEVVDNGVVVGTTGRPYIIQGIEPRSMSPRRLENNYACISKASMVSMGYAAVYATKEGLVLVQGGSASLMTRSILTEKEWADFAPQTITAFAHQGRYIGFYDAGGGVRRGFIIDPREPELGLVDLGLWGKAGFIDPRERHLYLLDDSNNVVRWDDPDEDLQPFLWRSKELVTARPLNISCAKVAANDYPVTFRLYGDGLLRYEREVTSPG
ncbi:MAG: hypothetical protein ACPH5V_04990, partial [Alcanivorax sp.]